MRKGKTTKVPYQPNGRPASATNSKTWNELPTCFAAVVAGGFDGVGYVLTPDDGRVCIDLDHCSEEDGTLKPWAARVVAQVDSYTERSPGGDGLHIWAEAHVSFTGRRHKDIEVYASERYITVTAEHWPGTPETLCERTDVIEKIVADFPKAAVPVPEVDFEVEIDPDAKLDGEKFQALMENEKRFHASWNHTRRDLSDDSLSSYDMSLSTIAAYAQWSDQEIANLIICHRRKYGNPDKALRRDYLRRTITRARQAVLVNLEDYQAAEVHRTGETREVAHDEGLAALSALLTFNVRRVVQRGRDPAYFALETDDGEIHIGSAEILLSPAKARARIIAKSPYFPKMTGKNWEHCIALICRLREIEDLGEGQRAQEAQSWVENYFREQPRGEPSNRKELADTILHDGCSFVWEGEIYLRSAHFSQYLFKYQGEKIPPKSLTVRLAEMGWKPHRFRFRDDKGARGECATWIRENDAETAGNDP